MPAASRSAHVRVRTVLTAAGIAAGTVLTASTGTQLLLSGAHRPMAMSVTRPAADREVADMVAVPAVTTEGALAPSAHRAVAPETSRSARRHRPAKPRHHVARRHRTQRSHHLSRRHHTARHHVARHHRATEHHHVPAHHHSVRHNVAAQHRFAARRHPPTLRRSGHHLTRMQKINRVIAVARAQRGKPYVWGAAGPHAFDCSGFVQWVYRHALGVHLPKYTDTQYHSLAHIRRSKLRRGDLIFVREGRHESHVGIYAGRHRWWVAPHTGSHVKLQQVWGYRNVYARVIP